MLGTDVTIWRVDGEPGRYLVHDNTCDPPYFWQHDDPDMTATKVIAGEQSGRLIRCPLGPSAVPSRPPDVPRLPFAVSRPLASSE